MHDFGAGVRGMRGEVEAVRNGTDEAGGMETDPLGHALVEFQHGYPVWELVSVGCAYSGLFTYFEEFINFLVVAENHFVLLGVLLISYFDQMLLPEHGSNVPASPSFGTLLSSTMQPTMQKAYKMIEIRIMIIILTLHPTQTDNFFSVPETKQPLH